MIYIMAHNKVNFNNFYIDETFDRDMYRIFLTKGKGNNSTETLINKIKNEGFGIDLEWKLNKYNPNLQNNNFHAPSIFYHTYVNNFEFKSEYIGFLEYDLSLTKDFTKKVKHILTKHEGEKFIIFPSIRHNLNRLYKQKNITTNGKMWYYSFFDLYKELINKDLSPKDFLDKYKNFKIPTQQSFICDIDTYKGMSKFVFNIVNNYENRNKYSPRPSSNLERFIGLYLFIESLSIKNVYEIPLQHKHSSGGVY